MRNALLACILATFVVCPSATAGPSSAAPNVGEMQLVAQLPAELPQRILGLTYDGQKLWATIYLGHGRYATLDPSTLLWNVSNEKKEHNAISKVSGAFESPGAVCFANGKLWIAGAYGESFGSINTTDWKVERLFKGKQRPELRASQFYSSMAYDGSHLWIAWHLFKYDLPTSQTQLLLKIDAETGKVVAEYPLPPGTRTDGTHGLTWDGSKLWHAKDQRLSAIDPSTGRVISEYRLSQIKRPSGLAWDGQALWIAEFDGKIWRLPFFAV
jgi:streptogramin lyase